MKEGKPFFYRIEASEFFAQIRKFRSDKELAAFIRQFASDLVARESTCDYSETVITEAINFINKKREAGSKGGKQKASSARAVLGQCYDSAISKSVARSSTEAVQKKKPSSGYSDDFLSFWNAYPKKTAKGSAWAEWQKLRPPISDVLTALEWQCKSKKWQEGYILDPERYIKRKCWEDEPEKPLPLADKPGTAPTWY